MSETTRCAFGSGIVQRAIQLMLANERGAVGVHLSAMHIFIQNYI